MKTFATAFLSLFLVASAGMAQPPAKKDLPAPPMGNGSASAKSMTLEAILKMPDKVNAGTLLAAANAVLDAGGIEESAFLFYAGQLRTRFDRECFPPIATSGEDPLAGLTMVYGLVGSNINPNIMAHPDYLDKVIQRLETFSPKAPEDYDPGYQHGPRKSEHDAYEAVKPGYKEFLSFLRDRSVLLHDPKYFAAFRVVQAYNFEMGKKRPTKETFDKARQTMEKIAQEKGIALP